MSETDRLVGTERGKTHKDEVHRFGVPIGFPLFSFCISDRLADKIKSELTIDVANTVRSEVVKIRPSFLETFRRNRAVSNDRIINFSQVE